MPGTPAWAGWLTFVLGIFASLGLALALALLLAPVTALIAGFFLDDVAEVVEARDYPNEPAGRPLPLGEAIAGSAKFLGVVILGNMLALFLLLVPGVNLIAFFLVNGYLLGREFFEFAAMRYRSPAEGTAFPRQASLDRVPGRADPRGVPGGAAAQSADAALCRRHDGAPAQEAVGKRTRDFRWREGPRPRPEPQSA